MSKSTNQVDFPPNMPISFLLMQNISSFNGFVKVLANCLSVCTNSSTMSLFAYDHTRNNV